MRRTAAAAVLGAGFATVVLSYHRDVAPVAWHLGGLVLIAAGLLAVFADSTRALVRDMLTALREDRRHTAALVLIVLIAAVVRAALLGLDSRYDEAYSFLNWVTSPIGVGTGSFQLPNNHLLNTVNEHYAWRLLGDGVLAMRFPAYVAGVLIVPAVYAAGRMLHGRSTGLLAAALAAGTGPLIEYSVNGRGYTLSWLSFALLIALSARIVTRRDPAASVLWMLVAALGLYAVPVSAMFLVPVGGWIAVCLLRDRAWGRLPEIALLPAGAGLAALVLYAGLRDEPGWEYKGPGIPDTWLFVRHVWTFLHERTGGVLEIVAIPLLLAGLALHRRTGRQSVPLALLVLASVPVLALALPTPPPFERTWSYLVIAEIVTVAAGVVALARSLPEAHRARARRALPVGAVLLAGGLAPLVAFGEEPYSPDDVPVFGARDASRWLRDESPGTPIFITAFTQPSLALHFRFEGLDGGRLHIGGPITRPGEQPAMLAVSRSRLETPEDVLLVNGFTEPYPKLRLAKTFDTLDLYAFVDPR